MILIPEKNVLKQADKPPSSVDATPKFGRLLLVLVLAVLIIVAMTFGSLAFYSSGGS